MQFAISVWVSAEDSAKAGSIFAVVDAANPGSPPALSQRGYWDEFCELDERRFKFAADAKKVIAQHGYFLMGASVTISEAFGETVKST